MWSVASKAISEDKIAFKQEYQNSSVKFNEIPKYCCIRHGYIKRALFRLIDVIHRVCMLSLIWVILGGFNLFIIGGCELLVLVIFCRYTNELSCIKIYQPHFI